jgi:hypothetical protein
LIATTVILSERCEQSKIRPVAAVRWEVRDLVLADDRGCFRCTAVCGSRGRDDVDLFGKRTDLHPDIQCPRFADPQHNVFDDLRLETSVGDGHGVAP